MGLKHEAPNAYLTCSGETAYLNGVALSDSNLLPVAAANYLAEASEGGYYYVTLPDVIAMNSQSITFKLIGSYYEGGFQIIAGTFGNSTATIDISEASSWALNNPGASLTLLADGTTGIWWVTSTYLN